MIPLFKIISFIILVYGFFTIFDISLFKLTNDIVSFLSTDKSNIKSKINNHRKVKEKEGIRKTVKETRSILEIMGKRENIDIIWLISIILFVLGTVLSLSFGNIFLVPVLSIGLGLLPFWYVIFTFNSYRKQTNEELETALSTITTSYIRSEDIILAVEENIEYLNPPVAEVFKFFLSQTRLITSNRKLAIENMKDKIDSDIFREWCDALIACQDNRNLKSILVPIVAKLSDTRITSSELEVILFKPMREFISMSILLLANIPIIRILNKDWYEVLVYSTPGKIVLAITILVIFVSLNGVIRLMRPVEYNS